MKTKFTVYFVLALFSIMVCVIGSGCTSSTGNVVGMYTHTTRTNDTYTITINSDGTYSDDSYSVSKSGTWTVEDTMLKFNPSVISWQVDKECGNAACPLKEVWVPSGNIKTYKIGVNQLTDENGIVWIKS